MNINTKYTIKQTCWIIGEGKIDEFIVGEIEVHIGVNGSQMEYYFPYIQAPKNKEDYVVGLHLYGTKEEATTQAIKDIESQSSAKIQNLKNEL